MRGARIVPLCAVALGGLLGLSASRGATARAPSVDEVLLRLTPAVVLVVVDVTLQARVDCGDGETRVTGPPFRQAGTGVIVDPAGFVLTNGHVVQPAHAPGGDIVAALTRSAVEAGCLPKVLAREGLAPGTRPEVEEELKRRIASTIAPRARAPLTRAVIHVRLANGTQYEAEVSKYSPPPTGEPVAGYDLALLKVSASDLPVSAVGPAGREVANGERVHVVGLPVLATTDALLARRGTVQAIVRTGRISGVETNAADHPVIRVDIAASNLSGGPVVDDSGMLVGLLTRVSSGGLPSGMRGVDHVTPAATVRHFLKGTGVALDAESRVTAVWYSALDAFFSGDYRAASSQLEQAAVLLPDTPHVQRLLAEARAHRTAPSWAWIAAGAAGLVGALALVAWTRRSREDPPTISVADAVRVLDPPGPVLLIDAREEAAYARSPVRVPAAIRVAPTGPLSRHGPGFADRSQIVVAYGTCPDARAAWRLARQLRRRGYRNVRILDGGLDAWVAAGLPVEPKWPSDAGRRRAHA